MYGVNGFVDYLRQNHAEDVTIDFFDSGTLVNADSQMPSLTRGNYSIHGAYHIVYYALISDSWHNRPAGKHMRRTV